MRVTLGVDEVAQCILRKVHAVDERQVDGGPLEVTHRVVRVEEFVARLAHEVQVAVKSAHDLEERVDADGTGPRQTHADAGADPDLEVGPRSQEVVKTGE